MNETLTTGIYRQQTSGLHSRVMTIEGNRGLLLEQSIPETGPLQLPCLNSQKVRRQHHQLHMAYVAAYMTDLQLSNQDRLSEPIAIASLANYIQTRQTPALVAQPYEFVWTLSKSRARRAVRAIIDTSNADH